MTRAIRERPGRYQDLKRGEWLEQKHKTKRKRRSYRKLHLRFDLVSGKIVCSDLTQDDVGEPTALPDLLDQVDGPVEHTAPIKRPL